MSLRILHVGAGARGRNWLEFVASAQAATSVACVEPDAVRGAEAVKAAGGALERFEDLDTALAKTHADAALIASPSSLHAEQAIRCLEAGLAVLVEKPFAPSVAEGRRVVEAGEAAGQPVVVAEQFRFVPAERTVAREVAAGRLGRVSNVVFTDRRRMPLAMHGPWVKDLAYPQLSEIAVHHFDSLLAFFRKRPASVAARAFNPAGSDYASGACSEALIELEDGIHVQYLGSLTANKFGYSLRVEGDGGDLWTNRKLVCVRRRGQRLFLPVKSEKGLPGDARPYPFEAMPSILEELRAAVQDGREAATSGRRNLWAVALVEAAIRSCEERRTVPIAELHDDERPLGT